MKASCEPLRIRLSQNFRACLVPSCSSGERNTRQHHDTSRHLENRARAGRRSVSAASELPVWRQRLGDRYGDDVPQEASDAAHGERKPCDPGFGGDPKANVETACNTTATTNAGPRPILGAHARCCERAQEPATAIRGHEEPEAGRIETEDLCGEEDPDGEGGEEHDVHDRRYHHDAAQQWLAPHPAQALDDLFLEARDESSLFPLGPPAPLDGERDPRGEGEGGGIDEEGAVAAMANSSAPSGGPTNSWLKVTVACIGPLARSRSDSSTSAGRSANDALSKRVSALPQEADLRRGLQGSQHRSRKHFSVHLTYRGALFGLPPPDLQIHRELTDLLSASLSLRSSGCSGLALSPSIPPAGCLRSNGSYPGGHLTLS